MYSTPFFRFLNYATGPTSTSASGDVWSTNYWYDSIQRLIVLLLVTIILLTRVCVATVHNKCVIRINNVQHNRFIFYETSQAPGAWPVIY